MTAKRRYWLMLMGLVAASIVLHLVSHGATKPLEKPLHDFPLVLGSWQGQDIPIEQSVLQQAGVDDYLNRTYEGSGLGQGRPISLYVGYYSSQQTGDAIHSPRNCLPGSGWQPESRTVLQLHLPGGGTAPVNLYVIRKGLDRELVVYWYQSHGRIVASDYWSKTYLVLDAIRYHRTDAALVRINTPMRADEPSPYERATAFALETMAPLQSILPR